MQIDCSKYATYEEYLDFIIENNAPVYDESALGCKISVDESWSVGYGELPNGLAMTVADLNYHTIPKLYATVENLDRCTISDFCQTDTNIEKHTGQDFLKIQENSVSGAQNYDLYGFDSTGISSVLAQPFLDVKGRGVIVGVIDTGVDYSADIFKESPVNSRIGVIWNQRKNDNESSDVPFGTVYTNAQINRALAAEQEGLDSFDYVPVTDEDGHGTCVAAIAAAAAPEAELAIVALKPAKQYLRKYFFIAKEQVVYEETDIMLGVKFLLEYATSQKKPLVLLLALATGSGSRTGATPLAGVLSSAAARTNVAVVTAVGNEADNRTHVSGWWSPNSYSSGGSRIWGNSYFSEQQSLRDSEPYTCELNVGADADGIWIELWAGNLDILSVGFVSPSGESVARLPAKERYKYTHDFIFEKTKIEVDYQVVEELSGFELVFIRMIKPAQGIWKINVYSSLSGVQGDFNMWLNMKKLIGSDTYFLNSNPDITLLEPSADGRLISVGSCNHRTGSAEVDSGRGYNARGEVKPDVVAPGVGISNPATANQFDTVNSISSNLSDSNQPNFNKISNIQIPAIFSGTSAAAAQVAGMAALLFQWGVTDGNDRLMGCNQIKSILTRGAVRSTNLIDTYPNPVSGYGKANIMDSFLRLR